MRLDAALAHCNPVVDISGAEDRLLADLVPVFSEDGHHHIRVIDGDQRLSGMITQTDLVRALYGDARG